MVQSVRHNIKALVLWIGILTALLLVLSAFFDSFNSLIQLETGNDLLEQISFARIKSIVTTIQESLQWLKP